MWASAAEWWRWAYPESRSAAFLQRGPPASVPRPLVPRLSLHLQTQQEKSASPAHPPQQSCCCCWRGTPALNPSPPLVQNLRRKSWTHHRLRAGSSFCDCSRRHSGTDSVIRGLGWTGGRGRNSLFFHNPI